MSPNTLALILIRVLAIYIFSTLLNFVPGFLASFLDSFSRGFFYQFNSVLTSAITLLVPGAIAGFLWIKAPILATMILRGSDDSDESQETIDDSSIYAIALSMVGVVLVVNAVPDLLSILSNWMLMSMQTPEGFEFNRLYFTGLLNQAVRIALGLLLIVKLQHWRQMLRTYQAN